jgi:uncharacterized protein YciI
VYVLLVNGIVFVMEGGIMRYYFCKLIPPRPTFQQDMTEGERALMMRHVAYWTELAQRGVAVAFGPVADPSGGYGIGIVELDDEADVNELERNDPTIESGLGFKYEVRPMLQAVLRP